VEISEILNLKWRRRCDRNPEAWYYL